MIKFIIARHDEKIYNDYLKPSLDNLNTKTYDIFDDDGENLSMSQKYNLGIDFAIKDNLKSDDIICFIHEDVKILDEQFKNKVEFVFENDKNIGLLGVIGTRQFLEVGMWWANLPQQLSGHIIQQNEDKEYHLQKGTTGYFTDIVSCDGLILMIKGDLLLNGLRFDTQYKKFDMYDIDICFQILEKGYDIAIADILVLHQSPGTGSLKQEWHESKNILINKWKEKGYSFPIMKTQFKEVKNV